MTQSYSLSYMSGAGQGRMIGMYINQIDYEFAKPLRVSFAIAYLHQPQGLWGARTQISGNKLLPSFRLDWQPSRNLPFHPELRDALALSIVFQFTFWEV